MMRRKPLHPTAAIAGFVWLLACLHSAVTLAASQERVAELMDVSGLEEQVSSAPETFRNGIRQAGSQNRQVPEEALDDLEAIGKDVFSADTFVASIRNALASELSNAEVDQLLEWYRSETGRRITEAELATAQPSAQQDMMREGAALMEQRPGLTEKARRINELVKGTEFVADLNKHTTRAIKHAVLSQMDSESQREQFRQYFDAQMDAMSQQVEQQAQQMMVQSAVYSYRNIKPARMDAYVEFLQTPAARRFTRVSMDGLGDTLKESIDRFAGRLAETF